MEWPKVGVIVLNWNTAELTLAAIGSLHGITYPNKTIYVVDNASRDQSPVRIADRFPSAIIIENETNLGFAGGNNIGIQRALDDGMDFVLLINSDTEVSSDFLEPMVQFAKTNQMVGAVQPVIYEAGRRSQIWNAGGQYLKMVGLPKTVRNNTGAEPKMIDWITGCCMLLKREVIDKTGLLDESFFAYQEDVDWSLRIRNEGYELYLIPRANIYHHQGASSQTKKGLSPYVHYLNARNRLFLSRKHAGIFLPIHVMVWFVRFKIHLGYFLIFGKWSKARALFRGFMHGLFRSLNSR